MLFIGSHATRTCSGDSQRGIFISPRYQLMTGIIYQGKRQFKRAIPACHGQKPWARHGQRKLAATFKMCKSFLKLGKENRTMSYDAMTAHVSIVFARYTMLSLEQRRNADKRSIGDLFFASYDELQDLRYMDALLLILKKFIDRIKERMLFMEKELDEMLNSFLEKLPLLWHNCLKHCA